MSEITNEMRVEKLQELWETLQSRTKGYRAGENTMHDIVCVLINLISKQQGQIELLERLVSNMEGMHQTKNVRLDRLEERTAGMQVVGGVFPKPGKMSGI